MKILEHYSIKGRGVMSAIDARPAHCVSSVRVRIVGTEAPTWVVRGMETFAMPLTHTVGMSAGLLLVGDHALPAVGSEVEVVPS